MKTGILSTCLKAIVLTLLLSCASRGISAEPEIASGGDETAMPAVPRWQPHDFAFTGSVAGDNPFEIGLNATVTGPDGQAFTLPCFYDGNGTWKVRVSPTIEGDWSLITQSDSPALNGRRATFTCVSNRNPQVHGGLRVDPQYPHHFIYIKFQDIRPCGRCAHPA